MPQVVEHLLSKHMVLSSNPKIVKKKKNTHTHKLLCLTGYSEVCFSILNKRIVSDNICFNATSGKEHIPHDLRSLRLAEVSGSAYARL
jgi:hypothetical protein